MKTMLEANLYLRSTEGMEIVCKIHDELTRTSGSATGKPTTCTCPTEIRGVLLDLDEIAVAKCIVGLEEGASL